MISVQLHNRTESQPAEFTQPISDQPLKVRTALARIETGNLGDVKPVGQGVSERRITFGPGYRVYFGQDGDKLVILLCGGTKKRQSRDIEQAKAFWDDYKNRKQKGN